LKTCNYCRAEIIDDNVRFCPECGQSTESVESRADAGDDLEFVVSEAHTGSPTFVGTEDEASAKSEDDLPIESNSDLMENEAAAGLDSDQDENSFGNTPIGDFRPPMPEMPQPDDNEVNNEQPEPPPAPQEPVFEKPDSAESPDKADVLSSEEKEELIRKLEASSKPTVPHNQPKPSAKIEPVPSPGAEGDMPSPKMAGRGMGVAYFFRNYIELVGSRTLHKGDELHFDEQVYELRPKKLSSGMMIGSAAAAFVLLAIVVIAAFVPSGSSVGQLAGVVLDDEGRPYIQGATVSLPELDLSVQANAQGIFAFSEVPAGSHRVDYIVDGELISSDYATIVDNKTSTLAMEPVYEETYAATEPEPAEVAEKPQPKAETSSNKKSKSSNSGRKSKKKSSKSKYAKVQLEANVDGARLKLNGETIGAGNMTFSKLSPGKYTYTVDAKGYHSVEGNVTLKAGKTEALIVSLNALSESEMRAQMSPQELHEAGMIAFRASDYDAAIEEFSAAIENDGSYAAAYIGRANCYRAIGENRNAHDDYILAARSHEHQGDLNNAIVAYNKAVEMSPQSIDGYLGRGDLYLRKGQEIAALADYESAKKIDKRSGRAHYGLGRARFGQGNYKKALGHFEDARKADPSNALVYQYTMLCHAARQDEKKVMKSFERFRQVATEEELRDLLTDTEYSSVQRIIEKN